MIRSGRTSRALAVLLAGVTLGAAGEILRVWVPGRLDLALWITALLVGVSALIRAGALTVFPITRWLAPIAWLIVPALIWRDSPVLYTLNLLGLVVLLTVAASGASIRALHRIPVSSMLRGATGMALSVGFGPLPFLVNDIRWADLPIAGRARRGLAVGAGFAAAAPVLAVFGALLGSADPLFAKSMSRLLSVDLTDQARHLVLAAVFGWISVGLLRGGFWREGRALLPMPPRPDLSPTATLTFVTAIGCLLAVFVGFQAGELFLSAREFQAKMGMTISEYARSGFFEMVWVATLSLPLLHFVDWSLSRREPAAVVRFHRITAGLVVLLALVLASALYRMVLYQSFYGLTEQRFYTIAFMLWLAGVLGWFGATVLRGGRSRFVPGALAGGFATLLALNLVNPDALIAGVNVDRALTGASLDQRYLVGLSADAVPTVMRLVVAAPAAEQCQLLQELRVRWGDNARAGGDWNLSRRRAVRMIESVRAPTPGCTAPETP